MALPARSIRAPLSMLASFGPRSSVRTAHNIAQRNSLGYNPPRRDAVVKRMLPEARSPPVYIGAKKADITDTTINAWTSGMPPDTSTPAAAASADVVPWPYRHGDRIWFWHHILDGLVVFSFKPQIQAMKALQRLPYTGKKLKPSKFRKDYWEPFAVIEFPEGQEIAGRSVYHMLRESQFLHSYAWDLKKDKRLLTHPETGKPLTTHQRGVQLNASMFPNTIADMAAVLGGLGKGNKIWAEPPVPEDPAPERQAKPKAARKTQAKAEDELEVDEFETDVDGTGVTRAEAERAAKAESEEVVEDEEDEAPAPIVYNGGVRIPAMIYWSDLKYKNHATSWPDNVSHRELGDVVMSIETRERLIEEAQTPVPTSKEKRLKWAQLKAEKKKEGKKSKTGKSK